MIYIPNLLTLLRIALVPWLIVALQEDQYLISLLIFVAAGLTDALDGFIAKRFNAVTKLGAILDPLADKALLVSSYVMLTLMGIVPFWLTVAVVFRDIVIVGGYLIILLFFTSDGLDEVKTSPLKISKLNTFLQIAFIVFVLSALSWSFELPMFTQIFSYVVLVTSVLSGAMYVFIGSMQATKYSESANE